MLDGNLCQRLLFQGKPSNLRSVPSVVKIKTSFERMGEEGDLISIQCRIFLI